LTWLGAGRRVRRRDRDNGQSGTGIRMNWDSSDAPSRLATGQPAVRSVVLRPRCARAHSAPALSPPRKPPPAITCRRGGSAHSASLVAQSRSREITTLCARRSFRFATRCVALLRAPACQRTITLFLNGTNLKCLLVRQRSICRISAKNTCGVGRRRRGAGRNEIPAVYRIGIRSVAVTTSHEQWLGSQIRR